MNENFSQLIELLKKDPNSLSVILNAINKNDPTIKEAKNQNEELSVELIKHLQEIYANIPPTQFLYEIIQKLKLPDLVFDYEEDNEYKWKCTVRIPDTTFIEEGYNNSKREAKKIAAEQMVFALLKSKAYGHRFKEIISNDYKKTLSATDENFSNKKRKRPSEESADKKDNDQKLKEVKSNPVLIPISKNKLPVLIEKSDMFPNLDNELKSNPALKFNFEIYCLKWERIVTLEHDLISLNNLLMSFESLLKRKFISLNLINMTTIGSFNNFTMRTNCIEVDVLIECGGDISEAVESIFEILFSNFKIENEVKINGKGIQVKNNNRPYTFNFYFCNTSDNNVQILNSHKKWTLNLKKPMSIEQTIAVKFLKSWRRSRSLDFLRAEIIEFIVMQMYYKSVTEIILSFYKFISTGMIFSSKLEPYQNELISQIPKKDLLKNECHMSMQKITEQKFSELL